MKNLFFVFLSMFIFCSCASSKWKSISFKDHDELKITGPKKGEKIVIIYSTNWCYWCDVAKKFMKEHKINFIERDYGNPQTKTILKQFADSIGYTERLNAVPIFVIGRGIFVGYNPEKILCEIGRKKCKLKLFVTWETPLEQ